MGLQKHMTLKQTKLLKQLNTLLSLEKQQLIFKEILFW